MHQSLSTVPFHFAYRLAHAQRWRRRQRDTSGPSGSAGQVSTILLKSW